MLLWLLIIMMIIIIIIIIISIHDLRTISNILQF